MELRHLRYFIAVAELRSVRAVSEQLHVTQPAISRQIQDLEEATGAALFERTPSGLKLTAAGEAYLHEAREILARVDAASGEPRRMAFEGSVLPLVEANQAGTVHEGRDGFEWRYLTEVSKSSGKPRFWQSPHAQSRHRE